MGDASKVIGGSFIAAGCIYMLIVYCLRERIRRAIVLIKGASQFLIDHKSSLVIPSVTFVLFISLSAMYFAMGVKYFEKRNYAAISEDFFSGGLGFSAFMYVWTMILFQFLTVLSLCIFICQWYFSYQRVGGRTELTRPLVKALVWPITYHFGSLCFGSLIIAIVTIIRSAAQANAKRSGNCLDSFLYCLAKCIEDLCRHLTKMALIMMAMTGQDFCGSAKEGMI